jgi:hypothetical protein
MEGPGSSGTLLDGRQSEMASRIARGVRRMLRARGYSSVTELPLLDGRRADVVALHSGGALLIVEIKSSPADFSRRSKMARLFRALRRVLLRHRRAHAR